MEIDKSRFARGDLILTSTRFDTDAPDSKDLPRMRVRRGFTDLEAEIVAKWRERFHPSRRLLVTLDPAYASSLVGELRVLVDGAARAEDEHLVSPGGGNIVDLPALGWLARQPGPRIWISHGLVTGVGDQASKALTAQCKAVCERARIQRVAKLADAAKVLGTRV